MYPAPLLGLRPLRPDAQQSVAESGEGLSLVVPHSIVVSHAALLSAVLVSQPPGRRFLSFGFPLLTLSILILLTVFVYWQIT